MKVLERAEDERIEDRENSSRFQWPTAVSGFRYFGTGVIFRFEGFRRWPSAVSSFRFARFILFISSVLAAYGTGFRYIGSGGGLRLEGFRRWPSAVSSFRFQVSGILVRG